MATSGKTLRIPEQETECLLVLASTSRISEDFPKRTAGCRPVGYRSAIIRSYTDEVPSDPVDQLNLDDDVPSMNSCTEACGGRPRSPTTTHWLRRASTRPG